jgi:hypothetical protein
MPSLERAARAAYGEIYICRDAARYGSEEASVGGADHVQSLAIRRTMRPTVDPRLKRNDGLPPCGLG